MPDAKIEDILSRLRADDRGALQELFQEYYLFVCKTIHRFIHDQSLTEDLAQEVFLRFWEKRQQIEVLSSLPAYLRRMAINEALGYLRRNKHVNEQEPVQEAASQLEGSAEEQYLRNELEHRVREAINQLPPKCRMVFQLSRYEELSYKEIAEQLDISVKTVENQMGKALRILRERLRPYLQAMALLIWNIFN